MATGYLEGTEETDKSHKPNSSQVHSTPKTEVLRDFSLTFCNFVCLPPFHCSLLSSTHPLVSTRNSFKKLANGIDGLISLFEGSLEGLHDQFLSSFPGLH